jgi:hypothetical protein
MMVSPSERSTIYHHFYHQFTRMVMDHAKPIETSYQKNAAENRRFMDIVGRWRMGVWSG